MPPKRLPPNYNMEGDGRHLEGDGCMEATTASLFAPPPILAPASTPPRALERMFRSAPAFLECKLQVTYLQIKCVNIYFFIFSSKHNMTKHITSTPSMRQAYRVVLWRSSRHRDLQECSTCMHVRNNYYFELIKLVSNCSQSFGNHDIHPE